MCVCVRETDRERRIEGGEYRFEIEKKTEKMEQKKIRKEEEEERRNEGIYLFL